MVAFAPDFASAQADAYAGSTASAAPLLVRETPARYDSDAADALDRPASERDRPEPPDGRLPERDRPEVLEVPDPFEDADALEDLGDEIATLAAHIHAATQRLLVLIADFDRRLGWELAGHRSCAHWLAFRTGIDLGAAREKVRTARVLVGLPARSAAMARGELSFSQVRALSRVATPDNEADLLELARGCTTAQLERMVRGWKRGTKRDEAQLERERQEARTLSIFPDHDGMYVVRGKLPPELGTLLMRADPPPSAAGAPQRATRSGASTGSRRSTPRRRPPSGGRTRSRCSPSARWRRG